MKLFQKILSLFLTVVLLCNMLPLQVFAEELQAAMDTDLSGAALSVDAAPAYIVGELESERTAYSKEFLMSDGLHMAVLYPAAVHYETDDGWQEIDNTLQAVDGVYTNTAGDWSVAFPQTLTGSSPVSVTRDGYTVSFTLSGELRLALGNVELQGGLSAGNLEANLGETLTTQAMQTAQAQVQTLDLTQALEAAEYPETVPTKLNSSLRYNNVYDGTHIVYDLSPGQVKESIVLEAYSDSLRGYCYTLNTGDLIPALQEDGSIYLLSRDSEEPVMTMPAPYLEDAANATSYDVPVSLTGSNGSYTLTYQLPQAWLASADRQWPVVLDPQISANVNTNNILDITLYERAAANYLGAVLECGVTDSYGLSRGFLKYASLPPITSSDVVVNAVLRLHRPIYEVSNPDDGWVEIHRITEDWSNRTATWTNQPSYDPVAEDVLYVENEKYYYWDVTDLVREWYVSGNTGFAMTMPKAFEDDPNTGRCRLSFYSSEYSEYTGETMPIVTIYFRNNNGLESYWDYTSASAGRAGTGSVNNFTGNLTWIRSDMGFDGNRMPVDISHVYNLNDINASTTDGNNSNDSGGNAFGMGIGWRTNYNELLYRWDMDSSYYVWEDGDGTDHYFYDEDEDGEYLDEDDLNLTLTVNGSGTETYCITDEQGGCRYFDAQGRLSKLVNNQETPSQITITYASASSKLISQITDGVGRKYSFTYANGLLSRISFTGTGTEEISYVSYGYEGNLLTSVTYKDGETCSYAYDANNCLTSAQDIDGYRLTYTYNTVPDDETWQPWRVQSVQESQVQQDNSAVPGSELTFSYGHNQTILTDHNGNKNILQFNDYGNLVSIQDGEGHAQFAQYALNTKQEADSNTDASARVNQLRLTSKMQNTVGNLLQNSSFERASNPDYDWSKLGSGSVAVVETHAYMGSKSLQVTATAANDGAASPVFTVQPKETVTFSAYVKNPNAAAKLAICGTDLSILAESESIPASDTWIRTQVTYTNNTGAALLLKACFCGSGSLDCVQVEKTQTASRYNLLDNGDFSDTSSTSNIWEGTPGSFVTAASAAAPTLEATAYSITGDPTAQKRLTQTLNISGSEGDCYVLTGWAMGNSVPLPDDSNRRFALSVTFLNGNTVVNECFTQFNPDMDLSNGWQYAACPAVATGAYTEIRVSLCYDYNANTVYFDGIQFYQEQFGVSYAYNDDGKLETVTDLQQQKTEYEYTENELTNQILPSGVELTYEYDDYHNVKTATSTEGQTYTFIYDTYGNNTKVTVSSDSGSISSTAAYTTDGNYMASATDALGNTVTYGYDLQTGMLEWTKYPGDEVKTWYTYDEMYRSASTYIRGTALTNSESLENVDTFKAQYSYENDLLTGIQTPTTSYSFSYGDFSLRSQVKVGNRTLASYSYTNDQNKYLQALVYGNGDMVEYTYDDLGRLLTQTYEDGDRITYSYDNDGALARITDSATGITTTYYYDLLGRQMKYVESGTNYTHSVGYTYDAENNLAGTVEHINGTDYTTSYTYDKDNRVTSMTANDTTKEYTYDDLGRVTEMVTKRGEQVILTEEYTFSPGTEGGATSQVATYTVTAGENVTVYTYTYDDKGNILSVNDGSHTTSYVYDAANQLTRENNQAGGFTHVWTYDNAGNILSRKEYAYTTGELGALIDTVSYGYGNKEWGDLLTSYDGKNIQYDVMGNPLGNGQWSYEWEHGRQLASMETYRHPITVTAQPQNYTGEVDGYAVFSVTADGNDLTYQWQYSSNRGTSWYNSSSAIQGYNTNTLTIQATDARAGFLYRCKITDDGGNVLYSDRAQIDLGGVYGLAILSSPKTFVGNYGDTAVFAASADGEGLTYQWQYQNGNSTAWWNSSMAGSDTLSLSVQFTQAREVYRYRCKVTDGNGEIRYTNGAGFLQEQPTWNFTYNSDGMRIGRTDGDTTYSYIYNGSQLTQMTVGSNTLTFAYDTNGKPLTVTLNGAVYYYTTNLQGDVTGIWDANGNRVAAYTYDAWGNVTVVSEHAIADYNPLTYRGYVYDYETGLYYVSSRYYDPEIGRWISPEPNVDYGEFDEGVGLLGYNVYAYCANNPVNNFDPDGEAVANIVGGVIGGVAGAALGYLLAKQLGLTGWKKTALIAAATVGGAALGAFLGPYVSKLAKSVTSTAKTAVKTLAKGELCFIAGTQVLTKDDYLPIESIKVGDYVYAENPETGEKGLKKVVQVYKNETYELVHINVNGEQITTTPGHPFYVKDKGWISADNLKIGDPLVTYNGEQANVEKVTIELLSTPVQVYNFEVEDFHTYFVGEKSILVHNKGCGLNKLADSYLKKTLKLNAHAIKKEYLGNKARIALYDLAVDKSTGIIYIVDKAGKIITETIYRTK